jgi:hypothetical protein
LENLHVLDHVREYEYEYEYEHEHEHEHEYSASASTSTSTSTKNVGDIRDGGAFFLFSPVPFFRCQPMIGEVGYM